MTTLSMPMCGVCVHLRRRDGDNGPSTGKPYIPWRCDAFPGGVPQDILYSEIDHRQPVDGDGGIQFAPDPTDNEAEAYIRLVIDPIFGTGAETAADADERK